MQTTFKRKYEIPSKEWLLCQYCTNKLNPKQIAKNSCCSVATVFVWLKYHDIPRRSSSESQLLLEKNKRKCDDSFYTKEWLHEQYWTNNKSILQISKELKCGETTVARLFVKFNIEVRKKVHKLIVKKEKSIKKTQVIKTKSNRPKIDESIYNKEWLEIQYSINKLTISDISKLLNCGETKIYKMMRKNNIPFRSRKESIEINPPKINYKKGKEHFWYNKQHTQESKKKISKTKQKIDRMFYTKEWLYEQYWINNLSISQISKIANCGICGIHKLMKEYEISRRTSVEGYKLNKPIILRPRGPKSNNWKGGVTSLYNSVRMCAKADIWKKIIKKRDNYRCVICNEKHRKYDVDHIKPFAVILFENNITSLEQALACEELWDINNGRTLCKKCHYDTETFGQGTKALLNELRASKISSDTTIGTQMNINTDIITEHSF